MRQGPDLDIVRLVFECKSLIWPRELVPNHIREHQRVEPWPALESAFDQKLTEDLSPPPESHKIAREIIWGVNRRMILDGKIDLDVPVEKAWDFLIDINKFSTCLPGIDSVTQIDDKTFDGIISATVGPISGKFNFRSTIVESNAPVQMVVKTVGTDTVTKSTVNADMTVDLRRVSDAKSEMDYKADVKIKGRLGILGDMVLRATATLILQEFTKRLHKGLGEPA